MTTDLIETGGGGFNVHLENFSGPFDLLLSLISRHQMEITDVAIASVTDEFLATLRAHEGEWDLSQASEFLVVAATLLDLKAARLLPQGEVDDYEDLELLERAARAHGDAGERALGEVHRHLRLVPEPLVEAL